MPVCTNCGKEILPGKHFCVHCGTKAETEDSAAFCTHCGIRVKSNSKFCCGCGMPFSGSVASASGNNIQAPENIFQNQGNSGSSFSPPITHHNNHVKIQPTSLHKPAKKKRSIIGCFLKTILIIVFLVVAGILTIYFATDWLDDTNRETNIKNFKSDVIMNLENTDATAGDLQQNGIQLDILEGTFDQKVKLSLKDPASVPGFDKNRAIQTGAPYEINIDQESKRLNKPVIVTLKLTDREIKRLKNPGDLWIGYYNGKSWDYFQPLEVNTKGAFVKFETYHFSIFSKAEPTREERINDFAYKAAVNQWAGNDNGTLTRQATEQMVNQILSKNMGLNNKSLTRDIVEAIMKENDYTKLLVSYNDNKMDEFGQDLAVLAGKKIFEVVSTESNAKILLGTVTEHSSKIGAGIKIGVALAEGDLEKAAKELSLEIINTFPLTKTFQTAAELTERQVNRWRDQELEAAYQVYINGAESGVPFWGYQVEPGNFDEVWSQMRGLETKILDDAIKNYAAVNNIDVSQLGKASLDQIRKQTKENLRQEFLKRKAQEAKIDALKEENIKLVKEFEDANLLSQGRFGYTDNTSFDFRLERLMRIKEMILKDTKSRLGFTGVDEGGIISAKTVAGLIQLWYSSDNGKRKYREELIKLGYDRVTKEVAAIDNGSLEGIWAGTFRHEELWLPGITGSPILFVVYNVGDKTNPEYRSFILDVSDMDERNSCVSVFPMDEGQSAESQFPAMLSGFKNGNFSFHHEYIDDGDKFFFDLSARRLESPAASPNFPEDVSIENQERAYAVHLRKHEESVREQKKEPSIGGSAAIQAIHSGAQDMIKDARLFYKWAPVFQRTAEKWLKDRNWSAKTKIEADRKSFSTLLMQH
jgi:cell division protein FtsB